MVGQTFEIVTVVAGHFFGDEELWLGDSRVRMFDRERALLDCFALPRRFGGVSEGLGILEEDLRALELGRLVAHVQRYGKAAVARHVGSALEHVGAAPEVFESPGGADAGHPTAQSHEAVPGRAQPALGIDREPGLAQKASMKQLQRRIRLPLRRAGESEPSGFLSGPSLPT